MTSKVYKQLPFRPRKGLRIIGVMRQTVGCCNRTRLSTPGAGWIAVLFLALGVFSSPLSAVEPTIYGAWLGPEVTYTQAVGDTWYATWAADGDLYVTSDDSSGFSGNCSSKSRKSNAVWVVVNRLQGDDPARLKGETANCMEAYDGPLYGPLDPNYNLITWKTTGILSVVPLRSLEEGDLVR